MITEHVKIVSNLDDLADLCETNFDVVRDHINDNEYDIADIYRRMSKKSSKLGVFLAVAAGIAYVVKNEYDKHRLTMALLEIDKKNRGCYDYTEKEI